MCIWVIWILLNRHLSSFYSPSVVSSLIKGKTRNRFWLGKGKVFRGKKAEDDENEGFLSS
jgi:hypothetical protein